MKGNRIIAIGTALALLLLCCACAPAKETPEQIVEKMQAALNETLCTQTELAMNMDVSMDAGEYGTMDFGASITSAVTVCQEPVSAHVTAAVEMNYGGEQNEIAVESYSVVEDGELVSYVNSSGIWTKVPAGQNLEDITKSTSTLTIDASNTAVDETVTEWQGKKAICLTTQVTGNDLQGVLDNVLGSLGDETSSSIDAAALIGDADFSALTCDARIYLDAETYLPMMEELILSGMDKVLAPVFDQLGITVDVTSCTATATFVSYEPQSEIKLPESVKENVAAWERLLSGEPDNGDGTFTIREGSVLIDVIPPEGFELAEKDYDHVYFTREDHRTVTYTMYYLTGTDATGSDFTAMVDSNASRYETIGGQVEREQLNVRTDHLDFYCDLLALTWDSGRQDADFYAWTPLFSDDTATYFLFVEVSDGYNDVMGSSKSADITNDEFVSYLNAAAASSLMG